jgi:hypothetical protein
MIARDIAFMGYNGGCGVDFFEPDSDYKHPWEMAFNESRRTEGHAPSLLAALAFQHESEEKYRHDPISLGGQFASGSILNALNKTGVEHYQTAPFYRQFMGNYNNVDNTTRDAGDDGFYNVEESNFICYQGLQAERGPDKTFSQYTTNTGHLVGAFFFLFDAFSRFLANSHISMFFLRTGRFRDDRFEPCLEWHAFHENLCQLPPCRKLCEHHRKIDLKRIQVFLIKRKSNSKVLLVKQSQFSISSLTP